MEDILYKLQTQRTSLVTVILALLAAAGGFVLLSWSNSPTYWVGREAWQGVVRDLGSLALVTVVFTFLWELSVKRSFVDELLAKARISQEIAASGMVQLVYEPHPIDWGELFRTTRDIDLFFAYAKAWRGTHENELATVAAREGSTIRVVLPDPADESVLEDLARRFVKTPEGIRERILDAKRDFSELRLKNLQSGATIEIWYTSMSPVFALYRFDKGAVVSLYSYQRYKGGVPHLVAMKGGSVYEFIVKEFQSLIAPDAGFSRRVE